MITYDALCKAYDAKSKANHAKTLKIMRLYRQLKDAIADDLGLNGKYYKDGKDESIPYITLGKSDELGGFEPVRSEYELGVGTTHQAGVPVPQIDAAIAITLESAPNAYPKQSIYVRIVAQLNGDTLTLVFADDHNMRFDVPIHGDTAVFKDVVDAYKQLVMNAF